MNKTLYSWQVSLLHFFLGLLPYYQSRWSSIVVKRERPMNLHGSIKELQNTIVQIYLKSEQHFSENSLIRELWSTMAHDVSLQISSMDALPHPFWNQLKQDKDGLSADIADSIRRQNIENEEDLSLKGCFERVLQFEEPTILKIYIPLIRKLRENLTAPALDFYIMVKAHLTRIARVTQSFSGNPVIIQRANQLLQSFEKEVQEPPHVEVIAPAKKKAQAAHPSKVVKTKSKEPVKKARKTAPRTNALQKRATMLHNRSKRIVKKVNLPHRRARR
jgi:hypothetical protein